MDLHYLHDIHHPESKLFPPHNMIIQVVELYGKVGKLYETIKAQPNVHFIDKTRYDSFFGTPLDSLLKKILIKSKSLVYVPIFACYIQQPAYNLGYKIWYLWREWLHLIKKGMNGHLHISKTH